MRLASAHSVGISSRDIGAGKKMPKEGSKLRMIYDMLTLNPGVPVAITKRDTGNSFISLRDIYGLDIRSDAYGTSTLVGIYDHKGKYTRYT